MLLAQDRAEEGVEFLATVADSWEGRNPFVITHNWWHDTLFLLDRDRVDEALELYDKRVFALEPF